MNIYCECHVILANMGVMSEPKHVKSKLLHVYRNPVLMVHVYMCI